MTRTWQTRVAAILTIGGLDAYALHLGHNGILMGTAMALIGAIAGYTVAADSLTKRFSGGKDARR